MNQQTREKSNRSRLSKSLHTISVIFLIIYLAVLFWQTFFYAYGSYQRFQQAIIEFNLVPFKTIFHYMISFNRLNMNVWFFNLFGNVIAFIPFGLLLPYITKKLNNMWRIIVLTVLLSFFIELMQIVYGVGVFDIDDIILNTVGGTVGYIIKQLISNIHMKT